MRSINIIVTISLLILSITNNNVYARRSLVNGGASLNEKLQSSEEDENENEFARAIRLRREAAANGRGAAVVVRAAAVVLSEASSNYIQDVLTNGFSQFDFTKHNDLCDTVDRKALLDPVRDYLTKLRSIYFDAFKKFSNIPTEAIEKYRDEYINQYLWLGKITKQRFTKYDELLPQRYGLFMITPHKKADILRIHAGTHVFKLFPTPNPPPTIELFSGNAHNRNLFLKVSFGNSERVWSVKGSGYDCTRKFLGDINSVFRERLRARCEETIARNYIPFQFLAEARPEYRKFGFDDNFSADFDNFDRLDAAYESSNAKKVKGMKSSLPRAVAVSQLVFTHDELKRDVALTKTVQQLVYSTYSETNLRLPRFLANCQQMWFKSKCYSLITPTGVSSDGCPAADRDVYRYHSFSTDPDCVEARFRLRNTLIHPSMDRSGIRLGPCRLPRGAVMPVVTDGEDADSEIFTKYGYYTFDWEKENTEWLSAAKSLLRSLKIPAKYGTTEGAKLAYRWIYSMMADFEMFTKGGVTCHFQSDSFEARNFVFSVRDNDGWGDIFRDEDGGVTTYQGNDLVDMSEGFQSIIFAAQVDCDDAPARKLYALVNKMRAFLMSVATDFWKVNINTRGVTAHKVYDGSAILFKIGCPSDLTNVNVHLADFCKKRENAKYNENRFITIGDYQGGNFAEINKKAKKLNIALFDWFFGRIDDDALKKLFT